MVNIKVNSKNIPPILGSENLNYFKIHMFPENKSTFKKRAYRLIHMVYGKKTFTILLLNFVKENIVSLIFGTFILTAIQIHNHRGTEFLLRYFEIIFH